MISKEELKKIVCRTIDSRKDYIIDIGESILRNPELGFRELRTTKLVERELRKLSLSIETGIAITGLKAKAKSLSAEPTIGIIGELDAIRVYGHPYTDEHTGAAHACGHNAQIAIMIGVAIGIMESGVVNDLDGNIAFIASPAEEFIELDYRKQLRKDGKIKFLGGKQEMIRLGAFDDVNISMMVHAGRKGPYPTILGVGGSGSAFVAKTIKYVGKPSHAGMAPERGINALNAAILGLLNIHIQRETFRDQDTIRVHPIITKGGTAINVVPEDVQIETYVRASTIDALVQANQKVDRAIKAGAMAIGASVEIENIPGYFPIIQNQDLAGVFSPNAKELVGEENYYQAPPGKAGGFGGDIGDVFSLMPGIMISANGWTGNFHSTDFSVIDEDAAYIIPTKAVAMTIIDLLYDDAHIGREIVKKNKPALSKKEYIDLLDGYFHIATYDYSTD